MRASLYRRRISGEFREILGNLLFLAEFLCAAHVAQLRPLTAAFPQQNNNLTAFSALLYMGQYRTHPPITDQCGTPGYWEHK